MRKLLAEFAAGGDRSKFYEIGKSLRKLIVKGEICGWEMQLSLGEIRKRLQRTGYFEIKSRNLYRR